MKKAWIIIGVILGVLILIQFIRPSRNARVSDPKDDIVFALQIPAKVKQKIVNACYDCHSEQTVYPAYSRITPINWMLANHINKGKKELNFSAWAKYDKKQQIKLLGAICDEISSGEMPLKSYVVMHSRAVINERELEDICAWTETAAEEIMSK